MTGPPPSSHDDLPLHPAAMDPQELLKECDTLRSRASGPGGQHRNKVQTAITLTHRPTGIQGAASERRSQAQNAQVALLRLRVRLAIEWRCDAPLRVDALGELAGPLAARWRQRVSKGRLMLNPEHEDFPAILAWVMDLLWASQWEPSALATLLGVSATQIIKLLRQEPAALAALNRARAAHHMHPLK